jgi:hypothetical protein
MTLLSPGFEIKEIDLSTTIANAATGRGATVGKAQWGPAYQISQYVDEPDLVRRAGVPNDYTAATFFSMANFLRYANDLRFVRVVDAATAKNSTPLYNAVIATVSSGGTGYVKGATYDVTVNSGVTIISTATVMAVSNIGELQLLRINSAGVLAAIDSGLTTAQLGGVEVRMTNGAGTGAVVSVQLIRDSGVYMPNDAALHTAFTSDTVTRLIANQIPSVIAKYPGAYGDRIKVDIINYTDYTAASGNMSVFPSGITKTVKSVAALFEYGPQTSDQYGVVVYFDGVPVETFVVSTKVGDKDIYGTNIYLDEFFEKGPSQYIHATSDSWVEDAAGKSIGLTFAGGKDSGVGADDYMLGWDLLGDKENIFVNLMIGGAASDEPITVASTVLKYVVDLASTRADCLALISPPRELVVNQSTVNAVDNIIAWRNGVNASGAEVPDNLNVNTSFASIDGNYKFQYDKYNDKNRWVPLSGDIAGLCAHTDQVAQAWYSPGGLTRGQIKSVVKLAIAPKQAHRDRLYEAQINPVISMEGEGTFLYGDKTATNKPSAFSRINVRRLFNLLEKAISDASKYRLFEINDEFTRNSFRTEVNAYLEGIRAQRGVYDYYVECSERNNTGQVIDNNEFRAAIMIKPARSINYVTLSFVATRTDANFQELLGSI